MKRFNPYNHLKSVAKEYADKVHEYVVCGRIMFSWSKDKLVNNPLQGYRMDDVYHRTMAAKQMGFTVELDADENGMTMYYKKNLPHVPYELR